jgi:hypothetical protein
LRTRTILIFVVALASIAFATGEAGQRLSPHESTTALIDGARVTITYGRPSMRGRRIMGALVQYGEDWTPGADEATTLETSRALRIGDVLVPEGRYSVWMRPTARQWTMFLNKKADLFHTEDRNPRNDLGAIALQKRTLDRPVEQLTFTIEPGPSGTGDVIKMAWETTEVSAPVTVAD